jgi:hypothetical protein
MAPRGAEWQVVQTLPDGAVRGIGYSAAASGSEPGGHQKWSRMRYLQLVAIGMAMVSTAASAEIESHLKRQAFVAQVVQSVVARDFASLDRKAEELRKSKARAPDGRWKVAFLYGGVEEGMRKLAGTDAAWSALDKQLLDFAKQRPKSENAWLFYAVALQTRAWQLRGTGFSSETTPAGRAAFVQYMGRARDVLDAHKDQLAANPEWYPQRIGIANFLGEGEATVDALFKEGVAKEPVYYGTYFAALHHRTPHWGGSIDAMVAFMNSSVRYATPAEGVSMYARLAWFADELGFYEVIESPAIDWKIMRQSFEDALHAFPDDWNAQKFLLMACEKPDTAEAKRVVAYVKEAASPALLRKNVPTYEACKALALGTGQPFMMRDPDTGKLKLIQ